MVTLALYLRGRVHVHPCEFLPPANHASTPHAPYCVLLRHVCNFNMRKKLLLFFVSFRSSHCCGLVVRPTSLCVHFELCVSLRLGGKHEWTVSSSPFAELILLWVHQKHRAVTQGRRTSNSSPKPGLRIHLKLRLYVRYVKTISTKNIKAL